MGFTSVGVIHKPPHQSHVWLVRDGKLPHRRIPSDKPGPDGKTWFWTPWKAFDCPSKTVLDVAAISDGPGRISLFVLTRGKRVLRRDWRDGKWRGWVEMGRPFGRDVRSITVASREERQIDVFVDALDGTVRHQWYWHGKWDGAGKAHGWHDL